MHIYYSLLSMGQKSTKLIVLSLRYLRSPFAGRDGSFFKRSGNANTPGRRQFGERRANLLNILRASSRHQHNRLPSSGRSTYPYPAAESCFQIHYCTHLGVVLNHSRTAAEQIFNFSVIGTRCDLSYRRSMPHQPIMNIAYTT